MHEPALHTEALTCDFGAVRAVDHLTMSVPRGTLFGFLGPNGAGKTTTIRLLLGLVEPTAGSATVLGFDTRTQAPQIRSRVGALLEHTGLYEQLTAEENLHFFARVWHLPRKDRTKRVRELLQGIGLWDRRKEPVGKWSRGMRQKLALARTLLHRPPLVLLDEPTAGLDVVAAAAVRRALRRMVEEAGVTVFLTTHNMVEAERLCDTVGVIRRGRLVAVDQPARLRERYGARRLEITADGITEPVLDALGRFEEVHAIHRHNGHLELEFDSAIDAAPVVRLLVEMGVAVQEVRKYRPTLEDVFLTLMEEDA